MTAPTLVRELFDLPDAMRAADYVVKLSEGVTHPGETTSTYVVTESLRDSFQRAFSLVDGALRNGQSQAAYVHGSFGSGKSHFMAMLSLLLDNNEQAWRLDEMTSLRVLPDTNRPGEPRFKRLLSAVGASHVLQLRLHMTAQRSIESALFAAYVSYVKERHPQAPLPPLFADQQLFADARKMLDAMGDEAFFATMNGNAVSAAAAGWGAMAAGWNRASFEQAASSSDEPTRAKLFDALARSWFSAYTDEGRRYLDIDRGLPVMASHAKSLGYELIVVFFDELVLWLASIASDSVHLQEEVQKLPKLVESADKGREIPLVSFVARQRDLSEMIGEKMIGAENQRLREQLSYWQGRFDRIDLPDQNLPEIVQRRILRPRNSAAEAQLKTTIDGLRRSMNEAFGVLLGGDYSEEDFRRVYPFSPALMDALVKLSSSLQRHRSALKLLVELITEHTPDLKLGDVVPVGDLFDLLVGGEEPLDGIMRARLEAARRTYRFTLLPVLHSTHNTGTPEKCQRLRPQHPEKLGCAGCPELACRNDNRILKALVLAALVPDVGVFKNLTVRRLTRLNHGTVRSPVPGQEASIVLRRLQNWASQISQLRVGDGTDPIISLSLEGIDTAAILDQAREFDQDGARLTLVRQRLFALLGVANPDDRTEVETTLEWRGSSRRGHVRFGNVRAMAQEYIRCADHHDWRLVIDYPWDAQGHGPNDDLAVIDRLRDNGGTATVVWLPSFFSDDTNRLVGDLAVLERLLNNRQQARNYLRNLTVEQQDRALSDLETLRTHKQRRLEDALLQAYGLSTKREGDLDESRSIDGHFYPLLSSRRMSATQANSFPLGLQTAVFDLLDTRYPKHPKLRSRIAGKGSVIERVLERFGQLVDAGNRRIELARNEVDEMRDSLEELGFVQTTDTTMLLRDDGTVKEIERRAQQLGVASPTVENVRDWFDEGRMGLEPEVLSLVARAYARATARRLMRGGRPFELSRSGAVVPDDVILERPPLPSQVEWSMALNRAAALFGINVGAHALHIDNLERFGKAVGDFVTPKSPVVVELNKRLNERLAELGVVDTTPRQDVSQASSTLLAGLLDKSAIERVRFLGGLQIDQQDKALSATLGRAEEANLVLRENLLFGVFRQLKSLAASNTIARETFDKAISVLAAHEADLKLSTLRELAATGQRLLEPDSPIGKSDPIPYGTPAPPPATLVFHTSEKVGAEGVAAAFDALRTKVEEWSKKHGSGDIEIVLEVRKKIS